MGGMGSGLGNRWAAKETTEDYRSIDVRRWNQEGLLVPGGSFGWQWTRDGSVVSSIRVRTEPGRVVLTYRHRSRGEDWKDKSYPVNLDWTDCHLGGQRPWFLCPIKGCANRVAILYGSEIFACRHCLQLAYSSQREGSSERAARKAERIRDQLGWEPGILNGSGLKPFGMHWKTYKRLSARHDSLVRATIAGMRPQLSDLDESLIESFLPGLLKET